MTSYIPIELREHVRDAATGRCAYCQSREALMGVTFEVDHIIPQSAGGGSHVMGVSPTDRKVDRPMLSDGRSIRWRNTASGQATHWYWADCSRWTHRLGRARSSRLAGSTRGSLEVNWTGDQF